MITGKTAVYCLLGNPVAHSLSPTIHNEWFRHHGKDAVYISLPVAPEDVATSIKLLRRLGVSGANVTLPFKTEALAAASDADPLALRIGAANTLIAGTDGGWRAHNSDMLGFQAALAERLDVRALRGRPVWLLGAGGSARAVAVALTEFGAALTVFNRTERRAHAMLDELCLDAKVEPLSRISRRLPPPALIVNATSMGRGGEPLPELPSPSPTGGLFFDLGYGQSAEMALAAARVSGWQVEDGLAMLVHQAAGSFACWFGERPATDLMLRRLRPAQ